MFVFFRAGGALAFRICRHLLLQSTLRLEALDFCLLGLSLKTFPILPILAHPRGTLIDVAEHGLERSDFRGERMGNGLRARNSWPGWSNEWLKQHDLLACGISRIPATRFRPD